MTKTELLAAIRELSIELANMDYASPRQSMSTAEWYTLLLETILLAKLSERQMP